MSATDADIRRLADAGNSVALIARQLGISRYRLTQALDTAPVGRNDIPYRFRTLEPMIIERYRQGDSGEAIGRALCVSTTAVYETLRRAGVSTRGKTGGHHPSFEGVLTAEYLTVALGEQDMTPAQIADQVGCSESTVRNWLRRHGLTPPPRARRLVYELSDELLDLVAMGERTIEDAAALVGCSRDEARRALRRSGRTLPADRRAPLTSELLQDLSTRQGMSSVAIAEATGWHFNAVRAAPRRHQIPRRISRPAAPTPDAKRKPGTIAPN